MRRPLADRLIAMMTEPSWSLDSPECQHLRICYLWMSIARELRAKGRGTRFEVIAAREEMRRYRLARRIEREQETYIAQIERAA